MTPTDTNPADELLAAESDRTTRARELGTALTALLTDVEVYKAAWRAALGVGFAKTDLVRAGFIDPARLPRPRRAGGGRGLSQGDLRVPAPSAAEPRSECIDRD